MRVNQIGWLCLLWLISLPLMAQDDPTLISSNTQIGTQLDIFDEEILAVSGDLYNFGTQAYTNINVYVEAYNEHENLIGEGFGYLVNACGTALLDYAMPPDSLQTFNAPFELFEDEDVASVKVVTEATAVDVIPRPSVETIGVYEVGHEEVVMLEWIDNDILIYGAGCDDKVFTELAWRQYTISDNDLIAVNHPDSSFVTETMLTQSGATMITQSGEQDPELYNRSGLTFSPTSRRVIYQNDLHTILSSEPDGSFKRLIHDQLHQFSLKGFLWTDQPGVFLAYYFGLYGEPVHYFTGNVEGTVLSGRLENIMPSMTIPGVTSDGIHVVVGGTFDDVTGYYLQSSFYNTSELLFDADLPGNNYPAPIVVDTPNNRLIYLVRPVDDIPTLQCWNRSTGNLSTLTRLPFTLTTESRAWAWISPDKARLAISANGTDGGLWWVNLLDFGECT
jgi:hypothetical protein